MAWTLITKYVHPADWGATVGSTPVQQIRFQVFGTSSDTTEMSATSILDISTITGINDVECSKVSIMQIQYDLAGVTYMDLLWDRTTDLTALRMVPGTNFVPYDPPLRDTSTGNTGDLVLKTVGSSATGAFTLDVTVLVHS